MSFELRMLAAAVVLGIVHVLAAGMAATRQRGFAYNVSSRDEEVEPLTGAAGRLDRASKNFLETFPFFAALVLMVEVNNRHSFLTEIAVQMYLYARILYLPVYGFGIPWVRSIIWGVAFAGMLILLYRLI